MQPLKSIQVSSECLCGFENEVDELLSGPAHILELFQVVDIEPWTFEPVCPLVTRGFHLPLEHAQPRFQDFL
jgi:hypothetical protein